MQKAIRQIQEIVPRGTFLKLEAFVQLLLKWNEKMNLISKKSGDFIWQDHVLDSLQALKYIKAAAPNVLDVGSGAGFPGIILSIATGWRTVLVEKNQKKCAFLKEAKLVTGANVLVENVSVESAALEVSNVDIITSRGVADIKALLKLVGRFLRRDSRVILWKGPECKNEIEAALNNPWHFKYECYKSDVRGMIVVLTDFEV